MYIDRLLCCCPHMCMYCMYNTQLPKKWKCQSTGKSPYLPVFDSDVTLSCASTVSGIESLPAVTCKTPTIVDAVNFHELRRKPNTKQNSLPCLLLLLLCTSGYTWAHTQHWHHHIAILLFKEEIQILYPILHRLIWYFLSCKTRLDCVYLLTPRASLSPAAVFLS